MVRYNKNVGDFGERVATEYLISHGYRILHKNYFCRFGELDIVALDGDCLTFIEVKTRTSFKYGAPEYAVNYWKQRHLKISARCYMEHYRMNECFARFDVVEVFVKNADNTFVVDKVNVIKNAF